MSAAFHRRVHRELARLESAGVIDARASLLIGDRYPTSGWDLVMLVRVFTIVGAIAAGAGAVLLAKDLSNALRLLESVLLVATVLLIAAGRWVAHSKGMPRAGASLEMLAGFALQGLTTVIAIHYSTGSKDWPALVGLQTVLLIALAYALDNRLVLAHACVTMFVWFGGETGYVSGWGMYWLGMSYPLRFLGAGFVALWIAWIHAEFMKKYQHFSRVYAHFGSLIVQVSLWFLSVFGNFGNPDTITWDNDSERLAYTALWAVVASGFMLVGARFGVGTLSAYGLVFLIINAYTFYFQFIVAHTGDMWWIHMLLTGTSLFFVGTWLERRLRGSGDAGRTLAGMFLVAGLLLPDRPALAQDPVTSDPAAYTVELENQWVRVLRLKMTPHQISAMHSHPDSIIVLLTDLHANMAFTDAKGQSVSHVAGTVLSPGPLPAHSEQNVSDQPVEAILVELKAGAPASPPIALDPVTLDPEHHITLVENPRVRAIRTILEPHLKSPMHEHPHYVVVYLTELHTTMTMADGRKVDNPRKPGDVAWRDALKHETENIGEKTAIEIQIEIK